MIPKKSIFNRIVGDSGLELSFAKFLDGCSDIVSFAKNAQNTGFSIEYRAADGSIASYFPDFVVKKSEKEIWIVETKAVKTSTTHRNGIVSSSGAKMPARVVTLLIGPCLCVKRSLRSAKQS